MIIGKAFAVKVNANINNSAVTSSIDGEVTKMVRPPGGGPTPADPSTGSRHPPDAPAKVVLQLPVPVGTVPIYRGLEKVKGDPTRLSQEVYRDTRDRAVEQGVDYTTVHAGVLLRHIPLTAGAGHRNHRQLRRRSWLPGAPASPPESFRTPTSMSCVRFC